MISSSHTHRHISRVQVIVDVQILSIAGVTGRLVRIPPDPEGTARGRGGYQLVGLDVGDACSSLHSLWGPSLAEAQRLCEMSVVFCLRCCSVISDTPPAPSICLSCVTGVVTILGQPPVRRLLPHRQGVHSHPGYPPFAGCRR